MGARLLESDQFQDSNHQLKSTTVLPVCPVCRSQNFYQTPYLNVGYTDFLPLTKLKNYGCETCGFGMAFPYLNVDVMNSFYVGEYRKEGSEHDNSGRKSVKLSSISPRCVAQLLLLKTFKNLEPGHRLLDIGAGGDATFVAAKMLGMNPKFCAVEADPQIQAMLKAQGVEVACDYFSPTANLSPGAYDGIIFSHVLEHFSGEEVLPVLAKIKDILAPGGIVMCEVPHAPLKTYHHRFDDSPHLVFWTKESLQRAAEAVGLKTKFISTCGITLEKYESLNKNRLNQTQGPGSKLKKILPPAIFNLLKRVRRSLIEFKGKFNARNNFRLENYLKAPAFCYRDQGIHLRAVFSKE